LICWILIHNLGKLADVKNYELRTRSLIDDWHLSKYLGIVLQSLVSGNKDISEALSLLKILVTHQNLFNTVSLSDNIKPSYMVILMSDPDLQQFLNFNRYQNILWFSAERFKMLMRWLFLVTLLQSFELNHELEITQIQKTLAYIKLRLKIAERSGYQVQKFLESDESSEI
jgi:hypothetical protein